MKKSRVYEFSKLNMISNFHYFFLACIFLVMPVLFCNVPKYIHYDAAVRSISKSARCLFSAGYVLVIKK